MNHSKKYYQRTLGFALLTSLFLLSECATIYSSYEHIIDEGTPKPYSGTKFSSLGVLFCLEPNPAGIFFLIDLPFSLVADTVLLPIVWPWYELNAMATEAGLTEDELNEKKIEQKIINAGGHEHWIRTGAFSPDSSRIATSDGNSIKLWNMNGMLHKTIRAGILSHLTFSPDGNLIAGADHKNSIRVYNLDGKLLLKYTSHKDDIEGIVFSPDGQKLASSSEDDTVRIWTITGKTLATMNIKRARMAMAFSPTSDSLITGGKHIDTTIYTEKFKHWQLDGTLIQNWDGNTVADKFLSRNPHEHIISKDSILSCFSISGGNGCKLFNAYGEVLQVFDQLELSEAMSIDAVSPDGLKLATNHKQLLTIWQIHDPEQKQVIPEVK